MADYKTKYRLEPKPRRTGGQAEVFRAENRLTGDVVALKRGSAVAVERLRREIAVQAFLDFDADGFARTVAHRAVPEYAGDSGGGLMVRERAFTGFRRRGGERAVWMQTWPH